jgi:all-trans-8'-apo-beta-carotenal 15,15'-oxygenase
LLEVGNVPINHPFDGDGMVCAMTFTKGRVHFCNRFVRTEGYLAEQKAERIVYRRLFGTQKPGGLFNNAFDLKLNNVANINVIYWGQKLLALWDLGSPYRLEPGTLDTLGRDFLDGVLESDDAFSSHPWIDPSCHLDGGKPCLVTFSLRTNYKSEIKIYEFAPDGGLLRCHKHHIPGFAYIHDFAITQNYCIFVQNPVSFNVIPFILGWKGLADCATFRPDRAARIVVIPRTPPYKGMKTFKLPPSFNFHNVNAYEVDDRIVLDTVCYQEMPQEKCEAGVTHFDAVDFNTPRRGQLWRFSLDLETNEASKLLFDDHCCEFPVIHPDRVGRKHRYVYLAAAHEGDRAAPLQAIVKFDYQTHERQFRSFAPKGYTVEPMFVPRPGAKAEDDGWLLVLVYNASRHCSEIVILDARDLHHEIARVYLKLHIPYGFHGHWSENVFV